jgi:hypothetical protein
MGLLKKDQGQLFYEFHLGEAVPEDHSVRKIDAALDLSWLRSNLQLIIRRWVARVASSARRKLIIFRTTAPSYAHCVRARQSPACRRPTGRAHHFTFTRGGLDDRPAATQRQS